MWQKENSPQCHSLELEVSRQSATLSTFQSLLYLRNRAKYTYSIFLEAEEACDHNKGLQSQVPRIELVTGVWIH